MSKVEPFYPLRDKSLEHKEAIEEFEKVEGSFTSEEQYWACRAGFIEGYEAAKEKYETKQQEHEDILCNCSQGKGIDFDEMGVEYCVSCQKQIN